MLINVLIKGRYIYYFIIQHCISIFVKQGSAQQNLYIISIKHGQKYFGLIIFFTIIITLRSTIYYKNVIRCHNFMNFCISV